MKRIVSLLLVLCFCVGLAACGKSSASSASPSAAAAPAATAAPAAAPESKPAAAPESKPAPAPTPVNLQPLVDDLNAEEVAQHTDDSPSIGVFEVGEKENTIIYKFAMNYFDNVILVAETGESEYVNAYNRVLDGLPALEISLENALRESQPGLNVVVYLMSDEYSDEVAAVVENGEIIYDLVNGVGTAPKGITPILEAEELPAEVQAKLDEIKDSLAANNG